MGEGEEWASLLYFLLGSDGAQIFGPERCLTPFADVTPSPPSPRDGPLGLPFLGSDDFRTGFKRAASLPRHPTMMFISSVKPSEHGGDPDRYPDLSYGLRLAPSSVVKRASPSRAGHSVPSRRQPFSRQRQPCFSQPASSNAQRTEERSKEEWIVDPPWERMNSMLENGRRAPNAGRFGPSPGPSLCFRGRSAWLIGACTGRSGPRRRHRARHQRFRLCASRAVELCRRPLPFPFHALHNSPRHRSVALFQVGRNEPLTVGSFGLRTDVEAQAVPSLGQGQPCFTLSTGSPSTALVQDDGPVGLGHQRSSSSSHS